MWSRCIAVLLRVSGLQTFSFSRVNSKLHATSSHLDSCCLKVRHYKSLPMWVPLITAICYETTKTHTECSKLQTLLCREFQENCFFWETESQQRQQEASFVWAKQIHQTTVQSNGHCHDFMLVSTQATKMWKSWSGLLHTLITDKWSTRADINSRTVSPFKPFPASVCRTRHKCSMQF